MMAAAQPFISGAISKTINLPNEATVEDIEAQLRAELEAGAEGQRALSRRIEAQSSRSTSRATRSWTRSTTRRTRTPIDDAARKRSSRDVAHAVTRSTKLSGAAVALTSDNLDPTPHHTNIIEKIVERIVERPLRRRLPDTRHAMTHKFDVAGHEGYITVGLYEDGSPGEVFITMAKEGSTIGGLMDTIATLVSVALQYGVPVESLVRKFEHVRFEPAGMTRNPEIPMAKSLVDYIFRWLAMEFVPGYRAANAPKRSKGKVEENRGGTEARRESRDEETERRRDGVKPGNGHGPRIDPDTAKPFDYDDVSSPSPNTLGEGRGEGASSEAERARVR